MHPTTYHELAHIRQSDLLREAANDRLAREARDARRAAGQTGRLSGVANAVSSLMHSLRPVKSASLATPKASAV